MTNDLRWAISSDQQIPYHDPRALDLWFKVLEWFQPDVVDYLGDTDDQACYSRFTEGRSAEFLQAHKDGTGDTMVIDSYSGAVKWRWYSPDDVIDIHAAIVDYHKGNPRWRLPKFPTKAELVSKLNKTEVLYYRNEDGDFLPVWKAPNW